MAQWDAIVIGSGLGGLTAGARAAGASKRVLLLERHDRFGGAATIFERKGLTVEVGLHEIDGLDEGDAKRGLFTQLGLQSQLEFVPVPEFYVVHSPSLERPFVMPHGLDEVRAATRARFPEHAAPLKTWFDTIDGIRKRLTTLTENQHRPLWWLLNGPIFPLRFWPIMRHEKTTVGQLLQQLFGDDDGVKAVLCANFQYYARSVNELSLLFFAAAQGSYHRGASYIRGGSQQLSDTLAQHIRDAGGQTLSKRTVQSITVEGTRVTGVIHSNRQGEDLVQEHAPVVFGNAAPHLLRGMLDAPLRADFEAPWKCRPLSTSLWSIYLGFDADPTTHGLPHYSSFFLSSSLDSAAADQSLMGTAPIDSVPTYVAVNYSRINHGLASANRQHLIVLCGTDRLENWQGLSRAEYKSRKQAWLGHILEDLLNRAPQLRGHVVYEEMATAKTVNRYLQTPEGAVYGFAQAPAHSGRHRPHCKTSIEGLYLASAFAQPGGGFTGAMLGGDNAFEAAANKAWQ